jgi:hypothetical protein
VSPKKSSKSNSKKPIEKKETISIIDSVDQSTKLEEKLCLKGNTKTNKHEMSTMESELELSSKQCQ